MLLHFNRWSHKYTRTTSNLNYIYRKTCTVVPVITQPAQEKSLIMYFSNFSPEVLPLSDYKYISAVRVATPLTL